MPLIKEEKLKQSRSYYLVISSVKVKYKNLLVIDKNIKLCFFFSYDDWTSVFPPKNNSRMKIIQTLNTPISF